MIKKGFTSPSDGMPFVPSWPEVGAAAAAADERYMLHDVAPFLQDWLYGV